jgi:hypothetical protein
MTDAEHEEHLIAHRKFAASIQLSREAYRAQFDRSDYGKQYDRKGHLEVTPKDPKFLSAREAWTERWQRLNAEGEALGYIEHEHCYECGGELIPTVDDKDRTWVYDETEEEFAARVVELGPYDPSKGTPMDNSLHVLTAYELHRPPQPNEGGTVTFKVMHRDES